MLSGLGHIFAGLTIRPGAPKEIEFPEDAPLRIDPPQADPELTVAAPAPNTHQRY